MLQEFAFITQIKDEPLALIVLGGIIGLKAFELAVKYIPLIFGKNKKIPVEETLKIEAEERKTWQEFVGKRMDDLESKIGKLFSAISVHEQFTNKISEGTLVNQLFSDELWPFLRLKAFRRLLAMGKNGRIKDKGFSLVLAHKEDWLNVLDTELGMEIVDKEYYHSQLNDIRRRIFDDFTRAREGVA